MQNCSWNFVAPWAGRKGPTNLHLQVQNTGKEGREWGKERQGWYLNCDFGYLCKIFPNFVLCLQKNKQKQAAKQCLSRFNPFASCNSTEEW